MKHIARFVVTFSVLAGCMAAYANPVAAQQNNNSNNSTQSVNNNVNCSSGSYGQTTCNTTTTLQNTQNNTQNQVLGTTTQPYAYTFGRTYKTENMGMDASTTAIAVVTFLTTTGGAVVSLKSKFLK